MTTAIRPKRARSRTHKIGYLFIAPFLLVFLVFQLGATIGSFGISLTNWKGASGGQFVGLSNYAALFADADFLSALGHTLVVWIVTVPILSFGALLLAHLLNLRATRAKSLLRTLFFLPVLPPLVVVGVLFLLLLDPVFGLPNIFLQAIGLPAIDLRNDPNVALPVLSVVIIWRWLGYNMTIHLAALQTLPTEVLESAKVDGVNAWQLFWHIVVPMSKPTLIFTAVMSSIGTFNLFDEPYVLFGPEAGPNQAGLMLGTYMFRQGFVFFNLGYASAIAYTVAIIVLIITIIQLRVTRND
ncbi:sugar ABC transporter permease [Salinibacterium sp. TMP30]|uniref:carbohydrate ABC transporter permease n=1 Tax=Salinibacterium sp. TMP30 TaxID=3138237 RepID=UPI0031390E74